MERERTRRSNHASKTHPKKKIYHTLNPAGHIFWNPAMKNKILNDNLANQKCFIRFYPVGTWERPIGMMPNLA